MAEETEGMQLGKESLGEFIGTFILIFIGNGTVAVSVAAGAYDLWAVSLMWFLAVALAIYAVGSISGAHINPAVTIALATFADFPWKKVPAYIGSQILGAFVASAVIWASFSGVIARFEEAEGLTRGEPGSQLSAMIFTTYAPNPAIIGTDEAAMASVPHVQWFFSQVIITAFLVLAIMYLLNARNEQRPLPFFAPFMIGLVVAALVAYEAPVSMAALNPARDLGPRIFTFFAGWGEIAFPGPRNGFWIPTAGTIVGGLIGGALHTFVLDKLYPTPAPPGRIPEEVEGA